MSGGGTEDGSTGDTVVVGEGGLDLDLEGARLETRVTDAGI